MKPAVITFLLTIGVSSIATSQTGQIKLLVLDSSASNGQVIKVELKPAGASSEVMIRDSARFYHASTGHFVYENRSGEWYRGDVQSRNMSLIAPALVPGNVTFAAITGDGRKIAWACSSGNSSSLVLTVNDTTVVLVNKEGLICAPSWSPQDTHLAYYFGPPGAEGYDGYRLVVVDLTGKQLVLKEVTPPSLATRLSPARTTPPVWSPDGRMLIFEGRYDSKSFYSHSRVDVDGKNLAASVGGKWSRDGLGVIGLTSTGNSREGYTYKLFRAERGSPKNRVELGVELPSSTTTFALSDNDEVLALVRNRVVFALDMRTKQIREVYQPEGTVERIYWVRQPPGSSLESSSPSTSGTPCSE